MEEYYVVVGYFEEETTLFGIFSTLDKANDFIKRNGEQIKIRKETRYKLDGYILYVESAKFYE